MCSVLCCKLSCCCCCDTDTSSDDNSDLLPTVQQIGVENVVDAEQRAETVEQLRSQLTRQEQELESVRRQLTELRRSEKFLEEKISKQEQLSGRVFEQKLVEQKQLSETVSQQKLEEQKHQYEKSTKQLEDQLTEQKQQNVEAVKQLETLRKQLQEYEINERIRLEVAGTTQIREIQNSAHKSEEATEKHGGTIPGPTFPHFDMLQKVYKDLIDQLLASNVAVEMFQRRALTLGEMDNIRNTGSKSSESEAADILLKIVLASTREVYDCFLNCVRCSGQEHVYKLIVCSDFDPDKSHCRLIQQHYLFLLDKLDTKTSLLVAHLHDADVLSKMEKENINNDKLTATQQNEKLLSLLSRKSPAQWKLFLTALDNTGQRHITDRITERKTLSPTDAGANRDVTLNKRRNRVITPIIGPRGKLMNEMPREILRLMLIKSFIKLFTDRCKKHTREAVQEAHSLAAVCTNWWETMNDRPPIPPKHWFKHKMCRVMKFVCRPYGVSPRLQSSLSVPSSVCGVTVCDNKLFVVCDLSNSILVFGPNNKQQANIELEQLFSPRDIVSCTETQQLYVAGKSRDSRCVWRVSLDSRQVVKWLPNNTTTAARLRPYTLSVTSRRLLVTSQHNNELSLYRADGVEMKRVPLPHMTSLRHAVETSRGTFIVSHFKPQPRVCEVNVDSHLTRVYCDQQQLSLPVYLSLDSDGRIFVADINKHHVSLLNGETLELERVLLDKQQHLLTVPLRLCYTQQSQLAVGGNVWNESGCVDLFAVRLSTD